MQKNIKVLNVFIILLNIYKPIFSISTNNSSTLFSLNSCIFFTLYTYIANNR